MTVVIDTNVLLQARAAGHPYHGILRRWMAGDFVWAISNEILMEYSEVVGDRSGSAAASKLARLLEISPHVRRTESSFRFHVITDDPDDNKFADCAIASDADWMITEDRHFQAMNGAGYKPQPIHPDEFIRRFCAMA